MPRSRSGVSRCYPESSNINIQQRKTNDPTRISQLGSKHKTVNKSTVATKIDHTNFSYFSAVRVNTASIRWLLFLSSSSEYSSQQCIVISSHTRAHKRLETIAKINTNNPKLQDWKLAGCLQTTQIQNRYLLSSFPRFYNSMKTIAKGLSLF